MCKQLDIDMVKFINGGTRQYSSVKDVMYSTALKMIKKLNEYTNENEIEVPKEILKWKYCTQPKMVEWQ